MLVRAPFLCLGMAAAVTIVAASANAVATAPASHYRYSAAEAVRGRALYAQRCVACHGPDMKGGEEAPPLVGDRFDRNWRQQPAELYAKVKRTMPQDDPGTLTAAQAADAVAAILNANGIPPAP